MMKEESMFKVELVPSCVEFSASDDISLLESALKNDVVLEYSCKTGLCGVCEALATFDNGQEVKILTCQYKPTSNIKLHADSFPQLAGIKNVVGPCKVDSIDRIGNEIIKLTLRYPPKLKFSFLPGQYIDLKYEGVSRSYSIASLPNKNNLIELHLKKVQGGEMSEKIFSKVSVNQLMQFEGPKGTFFLRDTPRKSIFFIVTGTGFAPMKAMLLQLISDGVTVPIHIYWGNRTSELFYDETINLLISKLQNVKYIPCLSRADESWGGRIGYVQDCLIQDMENKKELLNNCEVYACGSIEMIASAKKLLLQSGLEERSFYSDAFVAS